jgi:cytochrome c peroxidase
LFWDGRAKSIEDQVFAPVSAHNEMNLECSLAEERLNRSSFYKALFQISFNQARIDSVQISMAIAQFERSLISSNAKVDQVVRGEAKLTAEELRGHEVMNDQTLGNCLHCHTTDANLMGSTFKFLDNGFQEAERFKDYSDIGLGNYTGKKEDNGKFKIPSLRNVALTAPYMHDGSLESLEKVIDFYSDSTKKSPNLDSHIKAHSTGMKLSKSDKKAVISFLHCLTDSSFITNELYSNPFK